MISNLPKRWSQTSVRDPFIVKYNTKGDLKPAQKVISNLTQEPIDFRILQKGDLKPRQKVISNLAQEPALCKMQHKNDIKPPQKVISKLTQGPFHHKIQHNNQGPFHHLKPPQRWSQTSLRDRSIKYNTKGHLEPPQKVFSNLAQGPFIVKYKTQKVISNLPNVISNLA